MINIIHVVELFQLILEVFINVTVITDQFSALLKHMYI